MKVKNSELAKQYLKTLKTTIKQKLNCLIGNHESYLYGTFNNTQQSICKCRNCKKSSVYHYRIMNRSKWMNMDLSKFNGMYTKL